MPGTEIEIIVFIEKKLRSSNLLQINWIKSVLYQLMWLTYMNRLRTKFFVRMRFPSSTLDAIFLETKKR